VPALQASAASFWSRPARRKLAQILQDPAFIAEMKKHRLSAGFADARTLEATVERALTTLDAKGLAELKDIALNRYYQ
jgi:hypothetical protein